MSSIGHGLSLPAWIGSRAAEFRYAWRMVRKTPAVSAVAVLSLALGIGANTAIFSVVDPLLLKLLPVESPGELYQVAANPANPNTAWNYPDYCAFRDHSRSFSGLAVYSGAAPIGVQFAGEGSGGAAEVASVVMVSGNYFEVLGVKPSAGRLLNSEDERRPDASPYAVLSQDYFERRFAGDHRVVGRDMRLNGYPFTIVGIAQRGFRGTDVAVSPSLFIPVVMRSRVTGTPFTRWNDRHHWWLQSIGRLAPGATLKQAESELFVIYQAQEAIERRSARDERFVNRAQQIVLLAAARGYSAGRNRLEKPLAVLMAVVGLVLLIACANLASLMLARGAARRREIAVRLALGASRSRLAGQLLAESILIAFAGGAAGLLLAWFGVSLLLRLLPQSAGIQASVEVSPDLRLLGFTFAVSLLTGVLFGLVPALRSTKPDLTRALKDDAPGPGSSRSAMRRALVVVQVALSLILLTGAGLMVRSLRNLRDLDTGLRSDHTVVIAVDPGRNGYKGQRLRNFYERLRAEVERLPGVRSASLAGVVPFGGGGRWNSAVNLEGYQWKPGEKRNVDLNSVGPRYFETLGIPIVLGRDFREEDNPPYSLDPPVVTMLGAEEQELPGPRVAIVNEILANRFFAGRSPVGMHACFGERCDAGSAYEIVGVAGGARYFSLREAHEPMLYRPLWRPGAGFRSLAVRTTREAPDLIELVRRQVAALDPAVPVLSARTLREQIDDHLRIERLIATLSGFFGSLAVLLTGVGLYGVMSHAVMRRTREIGVRMALGARRSGVLWLVTRDAGILVLAGASAGIPGALALTRLLGAYLYGVSAQDPLTLAVGTAVLAGAAALASFLPARRATKVDPIAALRHE